MEKKKSGPKLEKFLLHYSFTFDGEEKTGWEKINAAKLPSYKEAGTLLKRQLHRQPSTAGQTNIKVIHLYKIRV